MVIHGALEARISVDGNVAWTAGADIQRIFENVNHWSSYKERIVDVRLTREDGSGRQCTPIRLMSERFWIGGELVPQCGPKVRSAAFPARLYCVSPRIVTTVTRGLPLFGLTFRVGLH